MKIEFIQLQHIKKITVQFFLLMGFVLSSSANAFQLKNLSVLSTQGEQLNAVIELSLDKSEDPNQISVNIASKDMYLRYGIDRSVAFDTLTFLIKRNDKGNYLLHLKSEQIIKESFLSVLMQIDIAGNKYTKEANFFIPENNNPVSKKENQNSLAPENIETQKIEKKEPAVSSQSQAKEQKAPSQTKEVSKEKNLIESVFIKKIKNLEKSLSLTKEKIAEVNINLQEKTAESSIKENVINNSEITPTIDKVEINKNLLSNPLILNLFERVKQYHLILIALFLAFIVGLFIKINKKLTYQRAYIRENSLYGQFPKKLSSFEDKNSEIEMKTKQERKEDTPKTSGWRYF
jgi:hypothetical protein